jgi:hypothetical protein
MEFSINWIGRWNWAEKKSAFQSRMRSGGKLPDGHVVCKPVPLYPRIEILEGVWHKRRYNLHSRW